MSYLQSSANCHRRNTIHAPFPTNNQTGLTLIIVTMPSSLKEKKQTLDDVVAAARKAKELDEKYKIKERSKKAATRAKELDEKYAIREKFRSTVIAAQKFNEEHKVVEKSKSAVSSVSEKAKEVEKSKSAVSSVSEEANKEVDESKETTSSVSTTPRLDAPACPSAMCPCSHNSPLCLLQTLKSAKAYNEKHNVLERTRDAYHKAKAFDEKHRVVERTAKSLAVAATFISSKPQKEDATKDNKTKNKSQDNDDATTKTDVADKYCTNATLPN